MSEDAIEGVFLEEAKEILRNLEGDLMRLEEGSEDRKSVV